MITLFITIIFIIAVISFTSTEFAKFYEGYREESVEIGIFVIDDELKRR